MMAGEKENKKNIKILLRIGFTSIADRRNKMEGYIKPLIVINDKVYKISSLRFTSEYNLLTILVLILKTLNLDCEKDKINFIIEDNRKGRIPLKRGHQIKELIKITKEIVCPKNNNNTESLLKKLITKDKRKKN